MMSSVDMEASWSSSASSTAMAAGAGADDDIARLIASGSERKGVWGGFRSRRRRRRPRVVLEEDPIRRPALNLCEKMSR